MYTPLAHSGHPSIRLINYTLYLIPTLPLPSHPLSQASKWFINRPLRCSHQPSRAQPLSRQPSVIQVAGIDGGKSSIDILFPIITLHHLLEQRLRAERVINFTCSVRMYVCGSVCRGDQLLPPNTYTLTYKPTQRTTTVSKSQRSY